MSLCWITNCVFSCMHGVCKGQASTDQSSAEQAWRLQCQSGSETQLLTIQFEWNGVLKSVSNTLVGVSPEFEIALYTVCFFVGDEDNQLTTSSWDHVLSI
ncbi:Poly(U)-specific endoribonuclease-A [Nymphaea thermarum]|nr:Poly(U)-specific endoribonuclease-A [Nymphaea thermarum]